MPARFPPDADNGALEAIVLRQPACYLFHFVRSQVLSTVIMVTGGGKAFRFVGFRSQI
jgi:hypothetical protein